MEKNNEIVRLKALLQTTRELAVNWQGRAAQYKQQMDKAIEKRNEVWMENQQLAMKRRKRYGRNNTDTSKWETQDMSNLKKINDYCKNTLFPVYKFLPRN